jgi:hypothetical protein
MRKGTLPVVFIVSVLAQAIVGCTTTTSTDAGNAPAITSVKPTPAPTAPGQPADSTAATPPLAEKTKGERAKDAFWAAFRPSRFEDLPAIRDLALAAYKEAPQDPVALRYAAYSVFWTVGESYRAQPPMTEEEEMGYRVKFMELLQASRELMPEAAEFDGWLGGNLVIAGRAREDDKMRAQGMQLLDVATKRLPLAGYIMRSTALEDEAPGTPLYDTAVEALFKGVEWCVDAKLDRNNPDLTPHMAKWTDKLPMRGCWSNPHTPHFQEGLFLTLGDMLVKQGNIEPARVAYRNAKLTPSFDTWKEKDAIDERLNSDLQARADLHRDSDPEKHPRIGVSCSGCHAN